MSSSTSQQQQKSDNINDRKRKSTQISSPQQHLVSLDDGLIGNVLSFLEFDDGPLALRQTGCRFSSLSMEFIVTKSFLEDDVLIDSYDYGTKEMQDLLRKQPNMKDLPNCGHCDSSNKNPIKKCHECKSNAFICKNCDEANRCLGCQFYCKFSCYA